MARQIPRFDSIEEAERLSREGYFRNTSNDEYTKALIGESKARSAYANYVSDHLESHFKPLGSEKDYFIPKRESNPRLEPIDPTYKPERGQIVETKIELITNTTPKRKWWQIWK